MDSHHLISERLSSVAAAAAQAAPEEVRQAGTASSVTDHGFPTATQFRAVAGHPREPLQFGRAQGPVRSKGYRAVLAALEADERAWAKPSLAKSCAENSLEISIALEDIVGTGRIRYRSPPRGEGLPQDRQRDVPHAFANRKRTLLQGVADRRQRVRSCFWLQRLEAAGPSGVACRIGYRPQDAVPPDETAPPTRSDHDPSNPAVGAAVAAAAPCTGCPGRHAGTERRLLARTYVALGSEPRTHVRWPNF